MATIYREEIFICTRDYFGPRNGILFFRKNNKYKLITTKSNIGLTFEPSGNLTGLMSVFDKEEEFKRYGLINLAEFREKRINSILCD
jgi:hypothetical protein